MTTRSDFSAYDKRITIESRATTRGTSGGQDTTWSVVCGTWAKITSPSARAIDAAGAMQASVTHEVRMRYRSNITPAMRVNYQGRYFNIVGILDENEDHVVLSLLCTEVFGTMG